MFSLRLLSLVMSVCCVSDRPRTEDHLAAAFKMSRDPQFPGKLEDIERLDLSPPGEALTLGCSGSADGVRLIARNRDGL
jgi:hypothetical protein